jgi:hypothetical protein
MVRGAMTTTSLRDEALRLLDHRGAILDTARDVSNLLRAAGIAGAVIGGVAVVLHGHVRTTVDVDVFVPDAAELVSASLTTHGLTLDPARREFVREGIPVHLVMPDQAGPLSDDRVEIDGITTVTLADLIAMKPRSGTANLLRAQDLADVIGLIRHHHLGGRFARHLDRPLRAEYCKLVDAIESDRGG